MKNNIWLIATLSFLIGALSYFLLDKFVISRNENKVINIHNYVDTTVVKTNNQPSNSIFELEKRVLLQGNDTAYLELGTAFLDKDGELFLPWAMLMANKYNSPQAYFDTYYAISELNNIHGLLDDSHNGALDNLDKETINFAISYLKKASDKGHLQAKETLGQYYIDGKYVSKNETLGNKLIKESKE